MTVPGAPNVRVFALGPPRDEQRLEDLNPTGDEEFHGVALASASPGNYFAAAAAAPDTHGVSPFAGRFAVPLALCPYSFGAACQVVRGSLTRPRTIYTFLTMLIEPLSGPDSFLPACSLI